MGSRVIIRLAASVGTYRRIVVADAAEEAVHGLEPTVEVPRLMLAAIATNCSTVAYGSGKLDTVTLTTKTPAAQMTSVLQAARRSGAGGSYACLYTT